MNGPLRKTVKFNHFKAAFKITLTLNKVCLLETNSLKQQY
jgi:hypothetical protein